MASLMPLSIGAGHGEGKRDTAMRVVLTATGSNHWGLADPIVHYVTAVGATIAEIQMYDHEDKLFAMLVRLKWPGKASTLSDLREKMDEISREKDVSIRTWSRDEFEPPPRLAICTTYRTDSAAAVLNAIRDGKLKATPAVVIGNRPHGRALAEQFGVDWHMIGDDKGNPDNHRMVELIDRYQADYIVLARYMRLVPASTCWKFAGGRIINLHHGLLPAFPGAQPYQDAFGRHMLTYGATVHFIVPELDAGNQIIHQDAFTVRSRHATRSDHPHGRTRPRARLPGRGAPPRLESRSRAALQSRRCREKVAAARPFCSQGIAAIAYNGAAPKNTPGVNLMKRVLPLIALLVAGLPTRADEPKKLIGVAYGTHPRQVLDFYQAKSDKPTPVVFYIHGGGWQGGDKKIESASRSSTRASPSSPSTIATSRTASKTRSSRR